MSLLPKSLKITTSAPQLHENNCPSGILGQVWHLVVSIPDLCTLTFFTLYIHSDLNINNNIFFLFNVQSSSYDWPVDVINFGEGTHVSNWCIQIRVLNDIPYTAEKLNRVNSLYWEILANRLSIWYNIVVIITKTVRTNRRSHRVWLIILASAFLQAYTCRAWNL